MFGDLVGAPPREQALEVPAESLRLEPVVDRVAEHRVERGDRARRRDVVADPEGFLEVRDRERGRNGGRLVRRVLSLLCVRPAGAGRKRRQHDGEGQDD